jgi:hypothetical protein
MPRKAHEYCGKGYRDFYQPSFDLSPSKSIVAKSLISFKVTVLRQAQHERFRKLMEAPCQGLRAQRARTEGVMRHDDDR